MMPTQYTSNPGWQDFGSPAVAAQPSTQAYHSHQQHGYYQQQAQPYAQYQSATPNGSPSVYGAPPPAAYTPPPQAAYAAHAAYPVSGYATGYAGGYPAAGYQTGYYQPQPVPDSSHALVLYSAAGTYDSFNAGNTATVDKPSVNPFTPGLAPLPLAPQPTTFVSKDPKLDKFPCSSKTEKDDPLAWITPTIFADDLAKVRQEKSEKGASLKELKEHQHQHHHQGFHQQFQDDSAAAFPTQFSSNAYHGGAMQYGH